MNYFMIEAAYHGRKSNFAIGKANNDIIRAEHQLIRVLNVTGFTYCHCYSYPDGSLYYYVRADIEESMLYKLLNALLLKKRGRIIQLYVREIPADNRCHKFDWRTGNAINTVAELFERRAA